MLRGYNAVTTVLDVGFLAGQYSAWERYEECGVVLNPYAAEVARPALRLVSGGGR